MFHYKGKVDNPLVINLLRSLPALNNDWTPYKYSIWNKELSGQVDCRIFLERSRKKMFLNHRFTHIGQEILVQFQVVGKESWFELKKQNDKLHN